nr:uncharacterized protein LOC128706623 [Cherax quadricarinatus]
MVMTTNTESNFDDLLNQLGTGRWQIFYMVALSYAYSLPSYHALGGAFLAPQVPYTCVSSQHDPDVTTSPLITSDIINTSSNTTINVEADITFNTTKTITQSECVYLVRDSDTLDLRQVTCTQWRFDNSTFTSTVTSEVCLTHHILLSNEKF